MTPPRHPMGVRTRLLIVVVVTVALALILMTLGFNVLLARSLSHDADALLRSRAASEAASVDIVNDRVVTPDQPDTGGLDSQAWVFRDGRALEGPRVSAALDSAARAAAATPGVSVDVPGLDTRLYATAASDDPRTMIVAGVSLAPYEHTRQIAFVGSLALALALLVLVALVARWMLRAALRPVASMTADAASWSEHDPDRRFAAGEPYDEISQLAATLDGLLDRLAASLRHEQRFSAEMSHELRTPLAKVRAEGELALRRERSPEDYRRALETIVGNAAQMTAIIETLVAAAQNESGLTRGHCDARAVIENVVASSCVGDGAGGVRIEAAPSDTPLYLGVDADFGERILQPVVENACRLARTVVHLSVQRGDGAVAIHVDDDGPGVRDDEREAIFEPGTQGSASAGRAPAGAGLGLALARRLARAAGGDIDVRPATDGGHFTVRLPAG
jgi:two-component system, OmpR family, sensor kinase